MRHGRTEWRPGHAGDGGPLYFLEVPAHVETVTLRKADRLIVLNHGKVVEMGTHEALIETGGLYARLCELQSRLSHMKAW